MGHGAWGMGHGAWSMGHEGMGHGARVHVAWSMEHGAWCREVMSRRNLSDVGEGERERGLAEKANKTIGKRTDLTEREELCFVKQLFVDTLEEIFV
jgi:hypothetical protein